MFLKAGRMLRVSTSSRRSRTRVSEGIISTPNSDLKFWAGTELSSKRIFTSKLSIDVIFKLNTASPVIRQSDWVMPRETTRSGTLSKHSRTSPSIPGIDRCLRNEFCVIFLLDLVLPEGKQILRENIARNKYLKTPFHREVQHLQVVGIVIKNSLSF